LSSGRGSRGERGFETENLLLRQQLEVLRRKFPRRVRMWSIDRLLFVWLYRLCPSFVDAIIIVQPGTVIIIRWHRRGFRAYWRWKFRHIGGRPRIDAEARALIRRMNRENLLWSAPAYPWRIVDAGDLSR
jgi:hypothetical protein